MLLKIVQDLMDKAYMYLDHDSYVFEGVGKEDREFDRLAYPLDYSNLIGKNLFEKFDDQGIPMKLKEGRYGYLHTKVFTWGLAHWNRYVQSQRKEDREQFLLVIDYILSSASEYKQGGLVLREFSWDSEKFDGRVSGAMEQGLAISLLVFAYQELKDPKYISVATKMAEPYFHEIKDEGVSRFSVLNINSIWLEEFPTKDFHVLNGALDALIGLVILCEYQSNDARLMELKYSIIKTVEEILPEFDRGYWSNYYVSSNRKPYIASMKYHMIHVYQLRFLAINTDNNLFSMYSRKFEGYSNSFINRLRALYSIAIEKSLK